MERRTVLTAASLLPLFAPQVSFAGVAGKPALYPREAELYAAARTQGVCVSFNTLPKWANWGALLLAFRARYPDIDLTYNELGSAATVIALKRAHRRPQADTAYYFAASALDAVQQDVVAPFRPLNFDRLPMALRHPEGRWFAVHTLTVAFVVNRRLVKTVPTRWSDLLRPEYKKSIVYMDPRTTGIGQMISLAANFGMGGDLDHLRPGAEFMARLHAMGNVLDVVGITPYNQFAGGHIPIWIGCENDGLKARYADGMESAHTVIPAEASVALPYAMSLVKDGPDPDAGMLWLNFVMSEVGQSLFAQGFVRPAVADIAMPVDLALKMPRAPQVRQLDVRKTAQVKPQIDRLWATAVLGA